MECIINTAENQVVEFPASSSGFPMCLEVLNQYTRMSAILTWAHAEKLMAVLTWFVATPSATVDDLNEYINQRYSGLLLNPVIFH